MKLSMNKKVYYFVIMTINNELLINKNLRINNTRPFFRRIARTRADSQIFIN